MKHHPLPWKVCSREHPEFNSTRIGPRGIEIPFHQPAWTDKWIEDAQGEPVDKVTEFDTWAINEEDLEEVVNAVNEVEQLRHQVKVLAACHHAIVEAYRDHDDVDAIHRMYQLALDATAVVRQSELFKNQG